MAAGLAQRLLLFAMNRCHYCYGTTPAGSDVTARETMRAIAILPWPVRTA